MIPYNPLLKPPLGTPLNGGHKLTEGLIGYWLMNEDVKDKVFDSSVNENTGTLAGNTSWVTGKHGGAINFTGASGDLIKIPHSPELKPDTVFSIVFSVKGQTQGDTTFILSPHESTVQDIFIRGTIGDGIGFHVYDDDNNHIYSDKLADGDVYDNVEHQVACVGDGSNLIMYLDGVQQTSGVAYTAPIATGTADYNIGAYDATWNVFTGTIGYMYFYNRALSPSEIALLSTNPFIMFKDPAEIALLGGFVEEEPPPEGIVVLRRRRESA